MRIVGEGKRIKSRVLVVCFRIRAGLGSEED